MFTLRVITVVILSFVIFPAEGIVRRLESGEPAKSLSRFIDYPVNARKDIFRPNTNFWAKGIDFSCASPWNSSSGALRAGTLISRRHIVYAAHYPLAAGTRIVFVDGDGNVCPCNLEKSKKIAGTDIMIGSLNAEVTPNINPARLLPHDFAKYLSGCGAGLPIATFNRQEKLFLTAAGAIPTSRSPNAYAHSLIPARKEFQNHRERIVVGDSGNPAFLLLNGEPVLLYCLHYGGCGAGPALHLYAFEIQRIMDELCPGYRLEFYRFKRR